MHGWKKKLRYGYVRLLRSPGAPREVARGLALGVFVAFLPIMGVQMGAALLGAELMRRFARRPLSRTAALAGTWLNNPLTAAPMYAACFFLGRPLARMLLPAASRSTAGTSLSVSDLTSLGPFALEAGLSLLLGGIAVGALAALIGYKLTLRAVLQYQRRRAVRRERAVIVPLAGA